MSTRAGARPAAATPPERRAGPPTRAQQVDAGAAARRQLGRKSLGAYAPAADRPDPVSIIAAQDANRVPELVPIRNGRMLASPFAFYRGAAAIMAADLGVAPHSGLKVQLCGDAHLSNFGVFASPERTLVFDVSDFDETLPGPFEWDVKRLLASFVIAGRSFGWRKGLGPRAATLAVGSYRLRMQEYAAGGILSTWYSRIALEDLRAYLPPDRQVTIDVMVRRAHARDNLGALNRLTIEVDGRHQFIDKPPLMVRVVDPAAREVIAEILRGYRATLTPERQQLLDRYTFVDLARKVVGVGSVGTQCWVAYFHGADENDPLFLQVKEAQASVLEPYLGRAFERHHGHRVVNGQRSMQASSDVFLGWVTGPAGANYYLRQLWDAKLSVDVETMREAALLAHAEACGWALARAHARSGSSIAIAAYVGTNGRFERSMTEYAEAYADQNARDHAALVTAVRDGRLQAIEGV